LALLLWSIVQPLQLNDDRKSKGEESYRASAVMYTYRYLSWVVALKTPSGSSVKRLLESHLEIKPSSNVYCTHSQRPDWYERAVHYSQYTGSLSMQGVWCNANQKPDCNSVMLYGIIIFYISAGKRDYYYVLHMGEGGYGSHMFMKSRLKGTCITGHQMQC